MRGWRTYDVYGKSTTPHDKLHGFRDRVNVSPNLPENYRYFAAKFCFGLVDNLLGNAGTEPKFCSNLLLLCTLILNNGVQGAICGS